jgi:hypothetical protein
MLRAMVDAAALCAHATPSCSNVALELTTFRSPLLQALEGTEQNIDPSIRACKLHAAPDMDGCMVLVLVLRRSGALCQCSQGL